MERTSPVLNNQQCVKITFVTQNVYWGKTFFNFRKCVGLTWSICVSVTTVWVLHLMRDVLQCWEGTCQTMLGRNISNNQDVWTYNYTPHEGCPSVWGRKGRCLRRLKTTCVNCEQPTCVNPTTWLHTSWGMFFSVGKKRKTSKDQPVWTATTHLMRDVLQCREAREVDVKQRSWQQAFVDHVRLQAEMKLGDVTDSENK